MIAKSRQTYRSPPMPGWRARPDAPDETADFLARAESRGLAAALPRLGRGQNIARRPWLQSFWRIMFRTIG
jgi:hypothetical protein